MRLPKLPTFARIRVTNIGSIEEIDEIPEVRTDDVVVIWTRCVPCENPFATVENRGVITQAGTLEWLPDDAQGDIVEAPRYAGMPEDLVKTARPIRPPGGSLGTMKTADGWPRLVWESNLVHHAVQGWDDPETSVEVLLCALSVAPQSDPELRPMLLAALKARYVEISKRPETYPPTTYPWRNGTRVGRRMLEYLRD